MSSSRTIAVLGSGNGGQAAAAILALAGHRVRLYGRSGYKDRLAPLKSLGGITLTGVAGTGFARPEAVTDDIEEALHGADVVVIAATATAHGELATLCGPHLSDGQTVVLFQGMAGGLIFEQALRTHTGARRVRFCETATLPYTCRLSEPGNVHVSRVSRRHLLAAFPGRHTDEAVQSLRPLFPFLVPATHVLETALYNPNPLLHPTGTLLNLGRIEYARGDFRIYQEGFTSSVWRLVHAVDSEKMALLRALDLPVIPYLDEFTMRNGDTFQDFASLGIKGPSGPEDRYITEDVPVGLVLFSSLGRQLAVQTPVSDALITIASLVNGVDYRASGRTLDRLGLAALDKPALTSFLVNGHRERAPSVQRPVQRA